MNGDAGAPLAEEMDTLLRGASSASCSTVTTCSISSASCATSWTASLTDLAEKDSWVKGQCDAMRLKIEEGLSDGAVRAVSDMLHHARKRHAEVRGEREQARDALKRLMTQMLAELAELGSKTGNFHESVGRYAAVIEESDSLESLTGVVREMVAESKAVQSLVHETQERLQEEHSKATDLTQRVNQLEDEMKRLSDEVSTDQLTQIANRRGLMQAFEVERARLERSGGERSIGLLDIDNSSASTTSSATAPATRR